MTGNIPRIFRPGGGSGGLLWQAGLAAIVLMFSGMAACRAEPAAAAANETADRLWQDFLDKYAALSLHPLDASALDEKAREFLIITAGPRFRSWKPADQPTFPALLTTLIDKDPTVSKFERIEKTLAVMVPKIDIYGHYKFATEVAQWDEALRQNPGSIHMTLDLSDDGRILCYPQPDGPAELAGVNPGAQLLTVDSLPTIGKTLGAMRLAFVGPPDTPITLRIKQPQGKIEELRIIRSAKESPIVTTKESPLGVTVRIRRFDRGSADAVKQQLEAHPNPKRLTLDLRGNPGGDCDEAFRVSSLFFPEGTVLGKFTTHAGVETLKDGDGVFVNPGSIQILQDERTASAAEYLIAALKEGFPDKVSQFGKRTYGKSHSTARVLLAGGGELGVTDTLLSTASGRSWDKTGIDPDQAAK